MKTVALRGRVVTDYEVWPDGTVLVEGDRIAEVHPEAARMAAATPARLAGERDRKGRLAPATTPT